MMNAQLKEDVWQITQKKTVPQIHAHNQKHDEFFKKRDAKVEKIQQKIKLLKKQISDLENKLYDVEHQEYSAGWKIEIEPTQSSYMTEQATADMKEFYENVIAFAHIHRFEPKFELERVYQLNDGKWYKVGVRIPLDEDGKMDESRTYFKKDEVEVQ